MDLNPCYVSRATFERPPRFRGRHKDRKIVMIETDLLRAELERLYELDELVALSRDILGFDPDRVGGTTAKASFATALTLHCVEQDAVEALCDVLVATRADVSAQVGELRARGFQQEEELRPGEAFAGGSIIRKLGEGRLALSYVLQIDGVEYRLKLLRREATRDVRGLHRFLTVTRLAGQVENPHLPQEPRIVVTERGQTAVIHRLVPGESLAERLARSGPVHFKDARPLVRGLLEALAALHEKRVAHGDVRLENVIVTRGADGVESVVLVDAGTDRLRARARAHNGRSELFSTVGSPTSVSPEQIRGLVADPASDVYSFGAVLHQLLTGKPLFGDQPALETAFGHLLQPAPLASSVAPPGWVSKELDQLLASLLEKDPTARPRDARAILVALDEGEHALGEANEQLSTEAVDERIARLSDAPESAEAAEALEAAASTEGAEERVADAFIRAADALPEEATEAKKNLLFRAARAYASSTPLLPSAESIYERLLALDPRDALAESALASVRRKLGKFEELIELLLLRAEKAESRGARARAFLEIGRLYDSALGDQEQALVALAHSLAEQPAERAAALELERICGGSTEAWTEVLESLASAAAEEDVPADIKAQLELRLGRWYVDKLQRPDLARAALQGIPESEPAHDAALEALAHSYRKGQEWAELAHTLTRQADRAATPAQARDFRAMAAEVLEVKLGDAAGARALYEQVLAEDPDHARASDSALRIYEHAADHLNLIKSLTRRADAQRGEERVRTLLRIAELYENELADGVEATHRYEEVLALDAAHPEALRGIGRIYERQGRYHELLVNLNRQLEVAGTPRQKVTLLERIAGVHAEEFIDPKAAAAAFERILELDPTSEAALASLERLYRSLERWEDLSSIFERHAKLSTDIPRKVALGLAQAKVLLEPLKSNERALLVYERVLELEPHQPAALEALARLRESSGDAGAALHALETLAESAPSPEARAEHWLRAGRLLEARGDRDGAIERFQRALDADPRDAAASQALRAALTARGDAGAAMQLLERELARTEGDSAKGKLSGQLARLLREGARDDRRAEEAARSALVFDPTNVDAQIVLGDLAFEANRYLEAAKHYEGVAGRAESLERAEASSLLVRYVDALTQTGSSDKALAPLETLLRIAADDAGALARVAEISFLHGEPARAAELHRDLLARFAPRLPLEQRALAYYRLGESERRLGNLADAKAPLEEAADLDPAAAAPLQALAQVFQAEARWADVIKAKTRHLDVASGDERVQLLIDIGELADEKLADRAHAARSFVAALEERPDDRKLLTKLMQLYSEEKDWNKLVEVVLRLADFVEDPKQKVKYLHTAAIVTARQAGDIARALEYYEQVLTLEPNFDKALNEAVQLERERSNWPGMERLLRRRLEVASSAHDQPAMLDAFQQLGNLYEKHLGLMDQAIDAFEAAQTLDPHNDERAEHLGGLYATDPEKYLEKAVASQSLLLRQNPFRPESYKALRRLYTETKQADASWCLCQTLSVLGLAQADEERFYKRMRSDTAAAAQTTVGDDEWLGLLMHEEADPLLTAVFALIEPAVIARRSQTAEELGFDASYLVDVTNDPSPVCQSLYYAAGVLGLQLPPAYRNPSQRGGISFLFTPEPSFVLGRTALRGDVPLQPAAFIAGQQLTYLRPGLYLRQLLDSGTALKAWLFGAIKLTSPQFPVGAEVEGAVAEATQALEVGVTGPARDQLTRVVGKLLTSGGALDLKRWVRGADLTADRVGFLLAHDLETASQIIRASDENGSSVNTTDRFTELALFSVSRAYFELRKRLGIAVDS